MDFVVLNRGEKIAGIAGVLLVLIMFIFDWFGAEVSGSVQGFGFSGNLGGRDAWGSYGFTDIVLFITALAAIGLALLAASDAEVGIPVAMSAVVTALGILSLILVIISIISPPSFLDVEGRGLDYTRGAGVWLGLLAVAAGGYLAMQEEGTSFGGEVDRFRGTGVTGGPGATPPPSPPPPPSSGPPSSTPPPTGGA